MGIAWQWNQKRAFFRAFSPFSASILKQSLNCAQKAFRSKHFELKSLFPIALLRLASSPQPLVAELEKKTPPLAKRLKAIQTLQAIGWNIGLRFDPIIDCTDFQRHYTHFFREVFSCIDDKKLHSVTLGSFRLPKPVMKEMKRLKPNDPLLSLNQGEQARLFCQKELFKYVDKRKLFLCDMS